MSTQSSATGNGLARWIGILVAATVLSTLFSIFVAQIFGAAALVAWIVDCRRSRRFVIDCPASIWALAAFLIWTIIAILASEEPMTSAVYLKKHLRLAVLPLATTYLTPAITDWWRRLFFVLVGSSAAFGVLQYAWLKEVDLLNRIDGFMSHWMTFSGQLMIGVVAVASVILFRRWENVRQTATFLVLGAFLTAALVLTLTRSALLGAAAGGLLLIQLRFRWWTCLLALLVASSTLVLMPSSIQERMAASFDLQDTTTRGRLDLLSAGIAMVRDNPLTGVGPRRVPRAAEHYRVEHSAPDHLYQHLHNNAVEIAASTGLPGLAFWAVWWVWLTVELVSRWRDAASAEDRELAATALGAVAAFQLAGLFEYNFGDAEVLMLVLFVVAMPLSAR